MPIAGSSVTKGSYSAVQQAAQVPAASLMVNPLASAAQPESSVTNAPLSFDVPNAPAPADSSSCQSTAPTTTTVHQICTCRSISLIPEAPAASSANVNTPVELPNQTTEQAAPVAGFLSSQAAQSAQQIVSSYGPFSSPANQIQSSFTSGSNY